MMNLFSIFKGCGCVSDKVKEDSLGAPNSKNIDDKEINWEEKYNALKFYIEELGIDDHIVKYSKPANYVSTRCLKGMVEDTYSPLFYDRLNYVKGLHIGNIPKSEFMDMIFGLGVVPFINLTDFTIYSNGAVFAHFTNEFRSNTKDMYGESMGERRISLKYAISEVIYPRILERYRLGIELGDFSEEEYDEKRIKLYRAMHDVIHCVDMEFIGIAPDKFESVMVDYMVSSERSELHDKYVKYFDLRIKVNNVSTLVRVAVSRDRRMYISSKYDATDFTTISTSIIDLFHSKCLNYDYGKQVASVAYHINVKKVDPLILEKIKMGYDWVHRIDVTSDEFNKYRKCMNGALYIPIGDKHSPMGYHRDDEALRIPKEEQILLFIDGRVLALPKYELSIANIRKLESMGGKICV